jgi:hypothetical protein
MTGRRCGEGRTKDGQRWAVAAIVFSVVLDAMNLRWVRINASFRVRYDGVVLPAIPESITNLDEFVGALVPFFVRDHFFEAHGLEFILTVGGNNVPPEPPFGEVIESRETAHHAVRRIKRGRDRYADA